MIANRIAAGMLVAGMMFVGACEPAQPTAPTTDPEAPGSPPATAPRTQPTTPGVTTDSASDRDLIVQPMMTRLESIREEIDELRGQQDQVPQENRAAFETAMNDVQSKYSNAVLHVDRLREAEGADLQRMRDQVEPIFQDLTTSLNQARALATGSGGQPQPGQPQPGQQPPSQPPANSPS